MTVCHSNINKDVLLQFSIYNQDIYKMFMSGKHSIQTNLPVPKTFNIANTVCISLDAYIDHILGHGIPISFAHISTTGTNFGGLQGSDHCWRVVNGKLANAPHPASTSFMLDYLWSDGFLGINTQQRDNSVRAMTVTLSLLSVI